MEADSTLSPIADGAFDATERFLCTRKRCTLRRGECVKLYALGNKPLAKFTREQTTTNCKACPVGAAHAAGSTPAEVPSVPTPVMHSSAGSPIKPRAPYISAPRSADSVRTRRS